MEMDQGGYRRYLTLPKGNSKISLCVHVPGLQTEKVSTAAFFLHSLHGCKLGPNDLFPAIADQISSRGIYSVRFDYVGNGESTWKEHADIKSKAEDTAFVINYICREFGINRISLVSISSSASLAFYLKDVVTKIDNMVFLSPMFTHAEALNKPGSAIFTRLLEYGRKLFHKNTYMKLIHGEIDLKAISTVLQRKRRPSNATPETTFDRSELLKATKHVASIPSMLVIGSRDPHCNKNMALYKSFIEKNGFNWETKVLAGAGHNYTSIADRDKVVGLIYQRISKAD